MLERIFISCIHSSLKLFLLASLIYTPYSVVNAQDDVDDVEEYWGDDEEYEDDDEYEDDEYLDDEYEDDEYEDDEYEDDE